MHERQPNPLERPAQMPTSTPTGEVVFIGENAPIGIPLHRQTQDNTCGQACLEMLGYDTKTMDFDEGGVSTADLFMAFDGEVVESDASYQYATPHMVIGVKKATSNFHWFLRLDQDRVVNPEVGTIEAAQTYLEREIDSLQTIETWRIPLGPNVIHQEAE